MPTLRITNIERLVVNVPFTPRCTEWNALLVWNWSIVEVIRVRTDAGLTGYGETLLHYGWGKVTDEAIARAHGRNPAELLGDDSLGPGLQMALYDVVGKALDVPVSALLGRRVRDWVPIAWWNTKMNPDALAEEAKEAVAAGYTYHKLKARPWIDVYDQVDAISQVTPESYRLDIDWNQMLLSAGEAVPVLRRLDQNPRVAIYETPIVHGDLDGYRLLRQKVERPVADHSNAQRFPAIIQNDALDGFVASGGVATMIRIAETCAEFGKNFWLQMVGTGITTALCAQLGAAFEYARWPAVTCMNNYTDDLVVDPFTIQGGYLRVPDGPGLGIEVDEDALERLRMEPPYVLPERAHILSSIWPNGRTVHYAYMSQMWTDFLAGNHPVQEPGARFEVRVDDGSKEWAELYDRVRADPVTTMG